MSTQSVDTESRGQPFIDVKIGNSEECLAAISKAIEMRGTEISQREGCPAGREQEHLRLAESEVLRPLACGVLDSNDEVTISLFCSALGAKNIKEIEVCVEPRRLILAGRRGLSSESTETATFYRVLQVKDDLDPSSATLKLKSNGSLLQIHIGKVRKESRAQSRAA